MFAEIAGDAEIIIVYAICYGGQFNSKIIPLYRFWGGVFECRMDIFKLVTAADHILYGVGTEGIQR